jgi:hypothetical protein
VGEVYRLDSPTFAQNLYYCVKEKLHFLGLAVSGAFISATTEHV